MKNSSLVLPLHLTSHSHRAVQRSRAPRWVQNHLLAVNPLPKGSMSTPVDAKWEEVAAYQYSQPFVSWHLLDADIGADTFTSNKVRLTPNQNQPLP